MSESVSSVVEKESIESVTETARNARAGAPHFLSQNQGPKVRSVYTELFVVIDWDKKCDFAKIGRRL